MSLVQNKNAFLNRKDAVSIFFCILIACAIFHSLFYTEYLYTDDWVALWQYKKAGFHGLISYGRYLTDVLTGWLYNITGANTVHDLIFIRLFSFLGWILCLPIWYFIIKKAVIREKLPRQLVFFSILYLICTPPFSIYAGWASCLEQFIAQTSGLISGYILYSSIKYKNERIHIPFISIGSAVVFGIISLFTYQNGFGCFFLPFLLHLIAKPKSFRILFIGIAICLLIYVIYYFAFRYSLKITGTGTAYRTKISIDIFPKIRFFFGRALAIPFHFTYLFNEKDLAGSFVYLLIFITWLIFDFYQNRILPLANRLKLFALAILILILVYVPSLIVKENYASNRTLFALNMAVFLLFSATLLNLFKNDKTRVAIVAVLSSLFALNAYYNFNQQFLNPVKNEYRQVRAYIETNYNLSIDTVYFIRPKEDFFVRKYGITRSWDEFGVPSTFFDWVPEYFVKQVIFEKTGNRLTVEKLIIKHWLGKGNFLHSSPQLSQHILLVDTEEIMSR